MSKLKLKPSEYAKEAVKYIHSGQPSKYKGKVHDELLIELFSQGNGYASFCAEAMICPDTYYEWLKLHPSFKRAHKLALAIGVHKWDKLALNKEIDGKRWSEIRRNRFGCLDAPRIKRSKKGTAIDRMQAIWQGVEEGDFDTTEANKLAQLAISQVQIEDRVPITTSNPIPKDQLMEQITAIKAVMDAQQKEKE